MIYTISESMWDNLSAVRDSKGHVKRRLSQAEVIEYLNSVSGFRGKITKLKVA